MKEKKVFQNHRYCQLCLRSDCKWCHLCVCCIFQVIRHILKFVNWVNSSHPCVHQNKLISLVGNKSFHLYIATELSVESLILTIGENGLICSPLRCWQTVGCVDDYGQSLQSGAQTSLISAMLGSRTLLVYRYVIQIHTCRLSCTNVPLYWRASARALAHQLQ